MIPAMFGAWKAASTGVKIGSLVALLVIGTALFWAGYWDGKLQCQKDRAVEVAIQAEASSRQALQGAEMGAKMAGTVDEQAAALSADVRAIERKGDAHAKASRSPSCLLDPAVVRVLDEYTRVLNTGADRVPPSDGSSSQREIPSGGVEDQAAARIPIHVAGEPVVLTVSELNHFLADVVELHGKMEIKYRGLSEWDDHRLTIERQHFMQEPESGVDTMRGVE